MKKEAEKLTNRSKVVVTDENELEFWREYKKSADYNIREALIKKYAPLVKYVAGKIAVGMPNTVEFDDLVSFGSIGLIDAVERYDPDRDIKFKTYAVTRIRGSIYDELRSQDWVPRSMRKKMKEIERATQALEAKFNRNASDTEIAREAGMEENEYRHIMTKIQESSVISLNDCWYLGDDSDEISVADTLESPESLNPDVLAERDEVRTTIIETLKTLPEKEKQVLILYYYEDLTLKEIGAVLEVTESRVSQLHTQAIRDLRHKLDDLKKNLI